MYCIDRDSDEPILLINKHIGFDAEDGQGIDGSLFQAELLALDAMGKKRIQVWINSPGGVVMDGYSIYNAILKSKTKVDTYCVGCAASIAGVIFQAGRKRIMADYGWLMYHMPFGGDDASLNTIADSLVTMIATRSGKSEDYVRQMMKRETFITADEALKAGFCDEVEGSEDYNKKKMATAGETVKAKWQAGNAILNSALHEIKFPKNNLSNMLTLKLITNKLGLNPDASEDNILAAITGVQNKAEKDVADAMDKKEKAENAKKAKDEEYDKLKAEMEAKQKEFDELKKKHDKMKADMEEADAKNKKEAEEKEEKESEDMVKNYAKIGRIKNDEATIKQWTGTCKKIGREEAKNLIEALPLNKVAPVITDETINKLTDGDVPMNSVAQMAKVQANLNKQRGK